MLGIAALALRVWVSATGRPLHFAAFSLRDKDSRPILIAAPDCDFPASATCASETVPALAKSQTAAAGGEPDSKPESAPRSVSHPLRRLRGMFHCALARFSMETGGGYASVMPHAEPLSMSPASCAR